MSLSGRGAQLTIRWRGGAITELAVPLPRHQPTIRADEDTIELIRRLAVHYDDGRIAGILNRQGRRSARGERFTAIIVGGLRRYRAIPAYQPPTQPPDGELMPVYKAAEQLGVAPSTIFRWLQAGFIRGEQDTPGAPWRIRVNDQLRAVFVEDAPPGYVPIVDAMRILGVSRQGVAAIVPLSLKAGTSTVRRRMSDIAIRTAHPSLILWYSYFNIAQAPDANQHWRNLA